MQARGRGRERHLHAARAHKARQQPLGDDPGDPHVPGLRPPLPGGGRAVQPGTALTALRRRGRLLPLARVRIPGQALPGMARLPAWLAVLPALPLRPLPRPAPLAGRDALLRGRRPGVRAVHPQPPLRLCQPQLSPPLPLPGRLKLSRKPRDQRVPLLQQPPQPRIHNTKPRSIIRHGLIGHPRRLPRQNPPAK
jgi:hypothetical protein